VANGGSTVGVGQTYGAMNKQQLAAAGGLGGSLGFPAVASQELVYMGRPDDGGPPPGNRIEARQQQAMNMMPIAQAQAYYDFMSPAERKRLTKMTDDQYGYETRPYQQQAFWMDLVSGAANNSTWLGKPITPWQYGEQRLSGRRRDGEADGGGGGGAYTGPVARVNLTDPDTASLLLDQSLQSVLGRQANAQERSKFMEALNAYEMKNPSITTPTMAGGQAVGAVTSGGVNPQAFAQRFAQAQEGAAEYQVATTFLDAFMDALGNPVK